MEMNDYVGVYVEKMFVCYLFIFSKCFVVQSKRRFKEKKNHRDVNEYVTNNPYAKSIDAIAFTA